MKSFKELKNNINELWGIAALGGNDQFGGTVPHVDDKITVSGNSELVNRLNAYIKRQTQREFVDPKAAFNMLRAKLNVMGLDFSVNPVEATTEGSIEFPMTRYGGAFGTTPEHDLMRQGFYNENGFEGSVPHSLVGTINIGPNGGYIIDAKIESKPE